MKLLITGGNGMLGRTLRNRWRDWRPVALGRADCDITDLDTVRRVFGEIRPEVVVHAAAMTAVDACESNPELAFKVNAAGSANVATACREIGARLVAISTDYVFSGRSDRPWREDDPTAPETVYGRSKLAGEQAIQEILPSRHLICRTAWLYGPGGPSFVATMLKLTDGSRPELKVVDDQRGNPTSTFALADILRELILRPDLQGIFHVSCQGECTWYEFACEIFRRAGVAQRVVPCTSAEFPRPARRPANSSLDKAALRAAGLRPMPEWQDALAQFFESTSTGELSTGVTQSDE
ncbi:MAG: dTDP-4-dehydrorhamnose reductase [Victivallaceae bacterium]